MKDDAATMRARAIAASRHDRPGRCERCDRVTLLRLWRLDHALDAYNAGTARTDYRPVGICFECFSKIPKAPT